MKWDTTVVIIMATCFAAAGFSASFVNGLAQWLETGKLPPPIVWIVVIVSGIGGAATNLIAFFSRTYGNYQDKKETKQDEKDKIANSGS